MANQLTWQTLLVGEAVSILPNILQLVEILHPKRAGSPPTGPTKAGAAVQLAQTVLTVAAAAGVIDNADAQNISAIAQLVQEEVASMKSQGKLGGNTSVPVEPVTVAPLAPKLPSPTGLSGLDLSKLLGK